VVDIFERHAEAIASSHLLPLVDENLYSFDQTNINPYIHGIHVLIDLK
jgi:hypothetical protein